MAARDAASARRHQDRCDDALVVARPRRWLGLARDQEEDHAHGPYISADRHSADPCEARAAARPRRRMRSGGRGDANMVRRIAREREQHAASDRLWVKDDLAQARWDETVVSFIDFRGSKDALEIRDRCLAERGGHFAI